MAGPQSPWAPGKERVLWGHDQGGLTRRIGIDPQRLALEFLLSLALLAGGHDRLPWPKIGRFWEHQWRGVLEGMRRVGVEATATVGAARFWLKATGTYRLAGVPYA